VRSGTCASNREGARAKAPMPIAKLIIVKLVIEILGALGVAKAL
jgi:hypothetical protein